MANDPSGSLVIVMPVYDDREAASCLLRDLALVQPDAYVVIVDDGSLRAPTSSECLTSSGMAGEVLRLRRNVGHQRAIAIGLCHVAEEFPEADRIVVMDADGEDRAETLPTLVLKVGTPGVDLVVAQRRTRVESIRFRWLYWGYKRMFEILVGRRIDFGNFMAMTPEALRRLASMPELWIHIPGCVLSSKLRIARQPLDRGARYEGQSKMSFVALALHGFRGLMVFSEDVLVRMGIACTLVAIVSLVGGVIALGMKLSGLTTPGWATTVIGVLLLGFLQMGALTLMMLMLAGQTRAVGVSRIAYTELIAERQHSIIGRRQMST